MEKIFSYNVDIDKTAYMNWRTRQHQPIHDMMIIADGYMKAAIMLAQDCLHKIVCRIMEIKRRIL